jgi:ATP-dependent DNA helicase RecQ
VQDSSLEIQIPARKDKKAPLFGVGDIVRMRRYGEGTVEMVSGDRVAVRCADDETRTFISRYVKRVSSPEAAGEPR